MLASSPVPTTPRPLRAPLLAGAGIAAVVCALLCLPSAPGLWSLLGLLLIALVCVSGSLMSWIAVPPLMVAVIPALIPSPIFALTFAWEIALYVFFAVVVLHGWRKRSTWLTRLSPLEVALLVFTGWGLFTGFWSGDSKFYLLGARRLVLGLTTLWLALRLPHFASRRWFDLGVLLGASFLGLAAIGRSLTTGFSAEQALMHRAQVTDLGWGTANYLASLLLLCSPSLLQLTLRGRRLDRVVSMVALGLTTAVQLVVASRAATVLFLAGVITQLFRLTKRFRLWILLGFVGGFAGLLASPAGVGITSRLDNIREFGSMTIRIWYFREAWRRLLENLPFGMGLGQGYAHADKLHGIDPHNYWLLLGGDLGVIGVVTWAVVLALLVRAVWTLRDREQVHTLTLTIVLANLHTLVEPTYQGVQYQLLFFWVVAGSYAYSRAHDGVRGTPLASSARG